MTFSLQSYNFFWILLPSICQDNCLNIMERTLLQQSWHFEPLLSYIFATKLQLCWMLPYCLNIQERTRTFLQQSWHFEPLLSYDIFATKLQLCWMLPPSILQDYYCLNIWRQHSCNKVDTLSLSSLTTFLRQSYNFVGCCLQAFSRTIFLNIQERTFLQQS